MNLQIIHLYYGQITKNCWWHVRNVSKLSCHLLIVNLITGTFKSTSPLPSHSTSLWPHHCQSWCGRLFSQMVHTSNILIDTWRQVYYLVDKELFLSSRLIVNDSWSISYMFCSIFLLHGLFMSIFFKLCPSRVVTIKCHCNNSYVLYCTVNWHLFQMKHSD